MVKFCGGVPINFINRVTRKTGYYISYNPSTSGYGCTTTALVLDDESKFFVLCGDHRKQYEALGDNFESCLEYFKNSDCKHEYSDKV